MIATAIVMIQMMLQMIYVGAVALLKIIVVAVAVVI